MKTILSSFHEWKEQPVINRGRVPQAQAMVTSIHSNPYIVPFSRMCHLLPTNINDGEEEIMLENKVNQLEGTRRTIPLAL